MSINLRLAPPRHRGFLMASPDAGASADLAEHMDSGDIDMEIEKIEVKVEEEIEEEIEEEDGEYGGGHMLNSVLVEDAGVNKGSGINSVLGEYAGGDKKETGEQSIPVEYAGGDKNETGEERSPPAEDVGGHKETGNHSAPAEDVGGHEEKDTQLLELGSLQEQKPSDTAAQQITDSNPGTSSMISNLRNHQITLCTQREELHVNECCVILNTGQRNNEGKDPVTPSVGFKNVTLMKSSGSIGNVNPTLTEIDSTKAKGNDVVSTASVTNHTMSEVGVTQRQPRLPVPPVRLREPSSGAEHDGANKKSKTVCRYHARGWCMKGNSCRFLHIKEGLDATLKAELFKEASPGACLPPQQIRENLRFSSHIENLDFCNVSGVAPLQIVQRSRDGYSAVSSLRGGFIERDTAYHGGLTSCSNASRDYHIGTRMSHVGSGSVGSDMVCSDGGPADNSKSSQSLAFGFTSWSTYSHAARNVLGSTVKHHASLESSFPPNIALHSSAELGNLSQNHFVADRGMIRHNTKFSSYAWESSIPFRSSHAITCKLLMKELPNEPKWDGTEKTRKREKQVKISFSDQGSSVKDFSVRPDCSSGEEKLENPVQVGETVEARVLSSSNDNGLKVGYSNNEKEVKVDGSGDKDEPDVDFGRDDHSKNESKAQKYFQTALIEYVKELVKPTWRQGLMSKDAHKLIVKKSVDKVLSRLQPHQIPVTNESVDYYLSSSHSKLAELVEAYIDIYGKT